MGQATSTGTSRRLWRTFALLALAIAMVVTFVRARGDSAVTPSPGATPPSGVGASSPETPRLDPSMVVHRSGAKQRPRLRRYPVVVPADYVPREHYYGPDPDAFIRQPHDYTDETPRELGGRTGHTLFDLERVQDMVRRGDQPGSEFARLERGALRPEEKRAARQVLQAFFDESTVVVDAVLDGVVSPAAAFDQFFERRRRRLNRELRAALGLSLRDFYELWPHVRAFDAQLARLDASLPATRRR